MVGDWNIILASFSEGWTQAWTNELDTTLSAGVGLANRDIASQTAAGHLVPVAGFRLDYHQESKQPIHARLDATLAPYADAYLRVPYQRFTFGGSIEWRPSDAWLAGASLSFVLSPYIDRAPESYGTAGLSASFAPVQFLVLSLGAFSQSQFQGSVTSGGAFRQWTTYLSVALRDRFGL